MVIELMLAGASLVANFQQMPTTVPGTLSIIVDTRTEALSEGEARDHSVERIQSELVSLSLRQAEVQERIQQVRHALLALVHVFGPEILGTAKPSPAIRPRA